MKRIRVAVLGYGHLGKWHCQKVEAHHEVAEFVAIVEKFSNGQDLARQNHPKVKIVGDIKEVMAEIDAAIVVTPTSTHFELVKELLENNKHVFCEKPLCSNDQEGRALSELAKSKDVVLQVGHSERFHESWEILRSKFQSLKAPFTVRINRAAPFKGRATDVDVVQDLAIHDLDLLLYLFKQRPLKIKASGTKLRTNNWDHANIRLQLEEGCEAYIMVGRNHVKEMRDLEVVSAEGLTLVDLFNNKIHEATYDKYADGSFVREINYSKRDHLLKEHHHFYQSIIKNEPAIIGIKDGMNAVHLVDCALKSIVSGQEVAVTLG
jgi:predicted dehydrogenase